uniref:non-specific serine/threonine protein kinase n=1 Tax=Parascaris univalens TaxID=6257 RepID=A0A915C9V4_PARUN
MMPANFYLGLEVCALSLRESTTNLFFPSRYRSDFEEIRLIGEGGFGKVFIVRSRIDNCKYAIKKIPFSVVKNSQMMKAINEVRLLASLQHENIVRYYGAWAEINSTMPSFLPNANIREISSVESGPKCSARLARLGSGDDSSQAANTVSNRDESEHSTLWQPSYPAKPPGTMRNRFWRGKASSSSSSSSSALSARSNQTVAIQQPTWLNTSHIQAEHFICDATMYVQMELCAYTLNEYLESRNSDRDAGVDLGFNVAVLKQLFSALDYIHSHEIIHRDVKPCNVFLRGHSMQLPVRILLGDFGLACHHYRHMDILTDTSSDGLSSIGHSIAVGTATYSAPEQLSSTVYDSAVDIYSAGIICYELYRPFTTLMERSRLISDLRAGKMDAEFERKWPDESRLVKWLCDAEPCRRPNAFEVLSQLEHFTESEVNSLKKRVRRLEKSLKIRDERIELLQKKVDALIQRCRQYNVPLCDLT